MQLEGSIRDVLVFSTALLLSCRTLETLGNAFQVGKSRRATGGIAHAVGCGVQLGA